MSFFQTAATWSNPFPKEKGGGLELYHFGAIAGLFRQIGGHKGQLISKCIHTCKNFIPMVVTRAMAKFFCQNGTFKPLHEIQKIFWPKAFFWSIMKMAIKNFFRIMTQGPPNPGFMQEKVQKGDFLKKALAKIDFFVVLTDYTIKVIWLFDLFKGQRVQCYGYFFLLPFSFCFKKMLLAFFFFQISCMGSKVPFWKNWKNATSKWVWLYHG